MRVVNVFNWSMQYPRMNVKGEITLDTDSGCTCGNAEGVNHRQAEVNLSGKRTFTGRNSGEHLIALCGRYDHPRGNLLHQAAG